MQWEYEGPSGRGHGHGGLILTDFLRRSAKALEGLVRSNADTQTPRRGARTQLPRQWGIFNADLADHTRDSFSSVTSLNEQPTCRVVNSLGERGLYNQSPKCPSTIANG